MTRGITHKEKDTREQWPRHEIGYGAMDEIVDEGAVSLTPSVLSDSIPVAQMPVINISIRS